MHLNSLSLLIKSVNTNWHI